MYFIITLACQSLRKVGVNPISLRKYCHFKRNSLRSLKISLIDQKTNGKLKQFQIKNCLQYRLEDEIQKKRTKNIEFGSQSDDVL